MRCVPWYLPPLLGMPLCDPWKALIFKELLGLVSSSNCSHCLPNCDETQYSSVRSTARFRRCDNRNLGVSSLCDLDSKQTLPALYGQELLAEYGDASTPQYLQDVAAAPNI